MHRNNPIYVSHYNQKARKHKIDLQLQHQLQLTCAICCLLAVRKASGVNIPPIQYTISYQARSSLPLLLLLTLVYRVVSVLHLKMKSVNQSPRLIELDVTYESLHVLGIIPKS